MADLRTIDDEIFLRTQVNSAGLAGALIPALIAGVLCTTPVAELTGFVAGTVVEDAIVDGVTTKAPSQNAVFDALALKANVSALSSYLTTAAAASTYLTILAGTTTYQPLDSDLTAIAALTTTSYGRSMLVLADQAALRTAAGYSGSSGVVYSAGVFSADTGTSGHKLPWLDGANTWSAAQVMTAALDVRNDLKFTDAGANRWAEGRGAGGGGAADDWQLYNYGRAQVDIRIPHTTGVANFLQGLAVAGSPVMTRGAAETVTGAKTFNAQMRWANGSSNIFNDGGFISFADTGGTGRGYLGMTGAILGGGGIYDFYIGSDGGAVLTGGSSFSPYADNNMSSGRGSNRWTQVYAVTGTINTSDMNAKTEFENLSLLDVQLAREIFTGSGWYHWKDSKAKKGARARKHFGLGAQRVGRALINVDYDPQLIAFFCVDTTEKGETQLGLRNDQTTMLGVSALYQELDNLRAEFEAYKLAA